MRALQGLEAAEAALEPARRRLHARLRLPLDRPQLRAAQALEFGPGPEPGGPGAAAGRLSDVHVDLPPPGVPGGVEHLVSGSYDYYHYCQVIAACPNPTLSQAAWSTWCLAPTTTTTTVRWRPVDADFHFGKQLCHL